MQHLGGAHLKLFSILGVLVFLGIFATFVSTGTTSAAGGPPSQRTSTQIVQVRGDDDVFALVRVTSREVPSGVVTALSTGTTVSYEFRVLVVSGLTEGYVGLASGKNGECPCASFGSTHFTLSHHKVVQSKYGSGTWDNSLAGPCSAVIENADRQIVATGNLRSKTC